MRLSRQFLHGLTGTSVALCLVLSTISHTMASTTMQQQTMAVLPETPAGKQVQGLVDAVNSDEADTMRSYVSAQFSERILKEIPLEEHVRLLRSFAERSGKLTLIRVLDSSPLRIRALIKKAKSGQESVIYIRTEATPPHKVGDIGISDARPWDRLRLPEVPKGKPTDKQVANYLDAFLKPLVAADAFSGSVLVAKEGKVVYRKAFGLASRAWGAKNQPNTKFNLGSMNKMLTSVAIAQLMERGKLKWDDNLGTFLPDWPNKDAAQKVKLSHLLMHTSGIGDYFNDDFVKASRDRFRAVSDYFPLYASSPLAFEPGSKFRYSNGGFMTLGGVVEKASGKDYFTYIRENIYAPAGMTNSDSYDLDEDIPNLAMGYTYDRSLDGQTTGPKKRYSNIFLHVIKGGPAGGGYSTTDDLFQFDQALRQGKLIKKETFERLLTADGTEKKATGADRNVYGFGFQTEWRNGQRIVGHSGGFPGINSNLDMYLDSGWTVVVLCNYDDGASAVSDRLKDWLTR
jgi:CubicO group peptidase (beta-lactamase class C family)